MDLLTAMRSALSRAALSVHVVVFPVLYCPVLYFDILSYNVLGSCLVLSCRPGRPGGQSELLTASRSRAGPNIHDKNSGPIKITAQLHHISHCKTATGTNWSNRWTYHGNSPGFDWPQAWAPGGAKRASDGVSVESGAMLLAKKVY